MYIKTDSPLQSWEFLKWWKHEWPATDKRVQEYSGVTVPHRRDLFKALELTPFERVKAVILGQDPYPTPGHAMGLAFSVYPHVSPLPRSLRNIFREYCDDTGYPVPRFGDLTPWAKEGVLLLNTCLTVEAGRPGSHAGIGWEKLTYEVLRVLSERGDVCFVLWGKSAQDFKAVCGKCPAVCAAHPSPFSANRGFFGSRPFSRVNEHLKGREINWRLP